LIGWFSDCYAASASARCSTIYSFIKDYSILSFSIIKKRGRGKNGPIYRETLPVLAAAAAGAMHPSAGGSGEMSLTREEDNCEEEEPEQDGEETCLAKKNGDEELLVDLKTFRTNWTRCMGPYIGPVDATTGTCVPLSKY
jgi:hypothetical protein